MSKKNRGFLALHVAHGSLGTCIIEATLPGWERPAGDPESWPEADQEQASWSAWILRLLEAAWRNPDAAVRASR